MKKVKKTLTILSITTLVGVIGLLISAIFGLPVFDGYMLNILITLGILTLACILASSTISYLDTNKVISIICLILLLISSGLSITLFWIGLTKNEIFNMITATVALITILINIIVTTRIKIGKRLMPLQVITYLLIVLIDATILALVFKVKLFDIPYTLQAFEVACVIAFGLLFVLLIIANKKPVEKHISAQPTLSQSTDTAIDPMQPVGDMVTITRLEYETMQEQIKELRKINTELMNSINPNYDK